MPNEPVPENDAASTDLSAAEAAGGQLRRLAVLEHSLVAAKEVLEQAETTMRSVRSGLVLEPMPAPVAEAAPEVAVPAAHVFRADEFFRDIQLGMVPRVVLALALILGGWSLGVGLRMAGVTEVASDLRAVLALQVASLTSPAPPRRAATVTTALPQADRLAGDALPVVIYERTSPYPTHFAKLSPRERHCLAEAIYFEARGEPAAGRIAVAQVVLNRALAGPWPRNICAVTGHGAEHGEKCQFSYACQRHSLDKPQGDPWAEAQGLADEILAGGAWLEEMLDATHFHRVDLKPVWRLGLIELGRFGRHVFYSSPTENRRPLSRVAVH